MPQTQQSGKQQSDTAGKGFGDSSLSPSSISKFSAYIESIKGKKMSASTMREQIMNTLFDGATDNPSTGKWYIFQYDPKFRAQLKEWDEYPLIHVMEIKKGNILGANIHYMNVRARLGAINNNRFPAKTLHYYIPKRADSIFFEVDDLDVPVMSQCPIEKFHRNR